MLTLLSSSSPFSSTRECSPSPRLPAANRRSDAGGGEQRPMSPLLHLGRLVKPFEHAGALGFFLCSALLFLLLVLLLPGFFYSDYRLLWPGRSADADGVGRVGRWGLGFKVLPSHRVGGGRGGGDCDWFEGEWVWDEGYPLYESKECPFMDEGFRCAENGRPDSFYTKWRWQPSRCDLPRLLGRSGRLNDAMQFIGDMPLEPGVMVWRALLGACLVHKNIELGKLCAERVLEIEPQDETTYILLSNLYATKGSWDDVALVRKDMRTKSVKKEPGCSWIEIQGEVHSFSVGDESHPDTRLIKAVLQWLQVKTNKAGYVPETDAILHDLSEDQKERLVWMHGERLALALGLVRVPSGSPIHIIKNLRFCLDCHGTFKVISKILQREIIVRDIKHFHRFEYGICSCGD